MWGRNGHETGRCSLFAKASDFFKCFRGNGGTKRELQIREKASAFVTAPLFELRIRGYAANFTIIPRTNHAQVFLAHADDDVVNCFHNSHIFTRL